MSIAFRGYPCRMKQAVRATALILLVSLISGCSSSPEPANKPQAKTECEIATEKSSELLEIASDELKTKGRDYAKASSLVWAFYTIEKGECFEAQTVASARTIIALNQK